MTIQRQILRERARNLRISATLPECLLWFRLRKRQLGVRFLPQRPIGDYIVDFVAAKPRLVIEVDGRSHDDRREYDSGRQRRLEEMGYTVFRFGNDEILKDLDEVVQQINFWLEENHQ